MSSEFAIQLVSGVLIRNNEFLLGLRQNTQCFDGYWSLPVGHVIDGESFEQAIKRELFEELGILVSKIKRRSEKIDRKESIFNQIFEIIEYNGIIDNKEPEKCAKLDWFSFQNLPTKTTSISKDTLTEFARKSAI